MNKTNKVHILSDSVFSIQQFFTNFAKYFRKRFIFQEPIQKVVLFLDVICITVFSRYDTNCLYKSYLELWVKSQKIHLSRTNYYLSWYFSIRDFLPSCTFSSLLLKLCKVSSISVYTFTRSCAHEKYGQTNRVIPIYPQHFVCGR